MRKNILVSVGLAEVLGCVDRDYGRTILVLYHFGKFLEYLGYVAPDVRLSLCLDNLISIVRGLQLPFLFICGTVVVIGE